MWTNRRSGLTHQRGPGDHRDPYERDLTRVTHSAAFRRLQRKTQILGTEESDFHRTRLTHSLEVASIGRSLIRNLSGKIESHEITSDIKGLLPNDDLISVICLLHDIGHPPFGHGGEVALNYMMRNHGGFEGNGQTLRLLTKIECSYGQFGLDLTRRAMLGILKYPVNYSRVLSKKQAPSNYSESKVIRINDWLPPKAYFDSETAEVHWLLSSFNAQDQRLFQSLAREPEDFRHGRAAYHNFDCSIMNTADDIAYGVHDLEDAIHLKLIRREQLDTPEFRQLLRTSFSESEQDSLVKSLFSDESYIRKQAIGEIVNYLITSITVHLTNKDFENPLLKYNVCLPAEQDALLSFLIKFIFEQVIDSQKARTFEYGGQTIILRLFEAISSNPESLLSEKVRANYRKASEEGEMAARRVICDYIANMTDEYAHRMHERLFGFSKQFGFL